MLSLTPTTFEDYIGHPRTLQSWKEALSHLKKGQLVYIYGHAGTGKSTATRLLTAPYNTLTLDSSNCTDSKELMDRLLKFQNWSPLFHNNDKEKVVVVDELETLLKTDRNTLNNIHLYLKQHGDNALPIVLLGDLDTSKKLGEIKTIITETIYLPRLQDADIFHYLKKRLPKNKIKLTDLMLLTEEAYGNIQLAIKNVEDRLHKRKTLLSPYQGDEHKTFPEIFSCRNPDTMTRLLLEDTWMHPLKIHENALTILDTPTYASFLKEYIFFEHWQQTQQDNTLPFDYLAHLLIHFVPPNTILPSMEFSKLLSYMSTQKKYKRTNYTFEDAARNKNIICH
jgi:energy-coupling factor transporter ATP-binding protein EcfA2